MTLPRYLLVVKPADSGPACSCCEWAAARWGRVFGNDLAVVKPDFVESLVLLHVESVIRALRWHGYLGDDKAMPQAFPYLIDTLTGRIDFDADDFAEMQGEGEPPPLRVKAGEMMAG